jgi:hypothetical protein
MSLVIDIKTKQYKYVQKECTDDLPQYFRETPRASPVFEYSYRDWKALFEPELANILSYIINAIEMHDSVASNGLTLLVDYKTLCDKLTHFIYGTSENRSKRYYFLK